jgi:hypothetical protein
MIASYNCETSSIVLTRRDKTLLLLPPFVLGPLARSPSELNWNCGSYTQLVGLLGRVINPSRGRYLHRATQTQKKRGQTCMLRVAFEPMIPVLKWVKTFHVLGRAAAVIGMTKLKGW